MEIVGRKDRPRLLVLGVEADTALGQHLAKLAPTIRFLSDSSEIHMVRQLDWDAMVVWDEYPQVEDHLFVLQFGGVQTEFLNTADYWQVLIELGEPTVSTEFIVPDGLPDEVARLVRNELALVVQERDSNDVLTLRVVRAPVGNRGARPTVGGFVESFLEDADRAPVAGRHKRATGPAEWWRLPLYTPNPERWASAAFQLWRELDPERFPGQAGWESRQEWRTGGEIAAASEVQRVIAERDAVLARIEQELAAAEVALAEAATEADQAERLLLTAQGDGLVAQVKLSLEELGFAVLDVDAEIALPGDRREDLRVTDSCAPSWIAIAEVRGYARGAQLNDLLRLGRFVTRFVKEEKRTPDSVWYLVNQFLGSDPSTRPKPLAANRAEVETFAEDGGLVMDTADLFKLLMSVRRGDVSKAAARQALRSSTGYFQL